MAKDYQVGDQTYSFPDDFTDQQVQDILTKQGVIKPVNIMQEMARKGEDLASHKHLQGMQPQKGEPKVEPPPALLPAMTIGAATSMVPGAAAAIPGGTTALRALLAGGAGAGLDAALGGGHPIRHGLEAAASTAALDMPGAGGVLQKILPRGLQPLLNFLSREAAPEEQTGSKLLRDQMQKFRGSVKPNTSSPAIPRGATPKPIQEAIVQDWKAAKNAKVTPFKGSAEPNLSPPPKVAQKATKKAEEVLDDWRANVKKKQLGIK